MPKLITGRKYEISGTIAEMDLIWLTVKGVDNRAYRVSAVSENLCVIGTDDVNAQLAGKRALP